MSNNNLNENIRIIPFNGGKLSQWCHCRFKDINGVEYKSAEQYMMAMKAILFNDVEIYERIRATSNSKEIKKLGRMVRNFDDNIWLRFCNIIVFFANYYKFTQDETCKKHLLSYPINSIFAECNPYDARWGIGLSINNPDCTDCSKWRGENRLGNIITLVRDIIILRQLKENIH